MAPVSPEGRSEHVSKRRVCNLQFFSELITAQLRDFHMVSPQVVFTLLLNLPHHAKLQVLPFIYHHIKTL